MTSPFIDGLKAQRIVSANGLNQAFVPPTGSLQVAPPGNTLFSDTFDGSTIDTVYRWNSPVLAGAGAITQSGGLLTATTGTGASSAAAISSIESFSPQGQGYLLYGGGIFMESAPSTNTHRFMGLGTPNASYTAATPLTDAVGWEYDITGSLNACIYSNTVRIFSQKFPTPLNGGPVILATMFRGDSVYFFLNNIEEAVASAILTSPNVSTLPTRLHMINHTSGPAVAPSWATTVWIVVDTGNNFPLVFNGQSLQRARSPGKFINLNAVSVASETTIWTPAAGRRFRLMGYVLETGTVGGNVTLKDNTGGSTALIVPFGAASSVIISPPMGNGYLSVAPGNVLTATGAATQTLSGYLFGTEE